MSSVLKQGPDALAALMAYVGQVRDRKLSEIQAAAAAECAARVDAARARAREQIRQALREVRADADGRVALARAAMQSRLRRARQALTLRALADVQARVEAAVRARWGDPQGRRAWVAMAFAEAARSLPPGTWSVAHGLAADLSGVVLPQGVTLAARAEPEIAAGLRIACGDAQVDATPEGLLRQPERVAALWLGEVERRRGGGGSP